MSATAATATEGPAEPAKSSLGKKLVMIVLLLVLSLAALGGGMAAAMGPANLLALLTGGSDAPEAKVESAEAGPEAAAPAKDAAEVAAAAPPDHGGAAEMMIMPFKEIIVNITATTATGRKTSRFLKMNLALVYDAAIPGAEEIEARKLFMRDSFQDYLRQLTERDLQGTSGLLNTKAELLRRARAIAGNDAPHEILVADLIVQ